MLQYLNSMSDYFKASLSVVERLQEDMKQTLEYIAAKEKDQKQENIQLQENIKNLAEQEKAASAKKKSATEIEQPSLPTV